MTSSLYEQVWGENVLLMNQSRMKLAKCIKLFSNRGHSSSMIDDPEQSSVLIPVENIASTIETRMFDNESEEEEQLIVEQWKNTGATELLEFQRQFCEVCIHHFSQLCLSFYFNHESNTSSHSDLLSLYERTDRSGKLVLAVDEQLSDEMQQMLYRIGYFRSEIVGIWELLFEQLAADLETTKNNARRTYHLENQKRNILEFEQAFNQLLTLNFEKNQKRENLKLFVDKWAHDIISHSFLKGLIHILNAQINEPTHVWAWNLPQVAFSQSAGYESMKDMICLLFQLGFQTNTAISYSAYGTSSEMIDAHRNASIQFVMDPTLSNNECKQLIAILPHESKLQTRALNDFVLVTALTRNVIEPPQQSFVDYLLYIWNLLRGAL